MRDGAEASAQVIARPAPGRAWWPHLLLLAMAIGWGASVSLATIAMSTGRDALWVALQSSIIGLACLSLYLAIRGIAPPLGGRYLRFYLVCGLLGTAAPGVLSLATAAHLPAGVRSIVFALIPMMTLACMAVAGRERASSRSLLGLALGLSSVLVLVQPGAAAAAPQHLWWLGLSIITVACYALENVYIDLRRPEGLDPVAALWGMTVAAILMLAPVVWWTGASTGLDWQWRAEDLSIVGMSVLNVACYAGYILLIGRAGPVFASQVAYLTPPAGIAWGVALLGESVTLPIGLSVALVLAGVALVRPRDGAG